MNDQSPLDSARDFLSDTPADGADRSEIDALGDKVIEVLKTVYDPEIPVNIFELGLIYKVDIDDARKVSIEMTLTTPACPVAEILPDEIKHKVEGVEGVSAAVVEVVWDPPWHPGMMTEEAQLDLGILY